ncbi:MAG: anti-sigma factor domain-containing protein [Ornithinibacter sp.]
MSPDLHHLSGAYAVDALGDAERLSFEQHLAVCADCRAEVSELSAAAHSLGSLTETAPPPSLRAAVLTGIARVRPLPPLTQDAAGPAPAEAAGDVPATSTTSSTEDAVPDTGEVGAGAGERVVPIGRHRRHRRTAWLAAAAAAAVIAVGGLVWSPWSDDPAPPSPLAQVTTAVDAQRVSSSRGGVTTEVVYSKQLGKAAISVKGLPPAPSGKTYQLWYVGAGGTITSAGLFTVDDDGSGQAVLAGQAEPTDKVAVSVEPAGGSAQPTTDPLVVLPLV